jgi:hypothetical protein
LPLAEVVDVVVMLSLDEDVETGDVEEDVEEELVAKVDEEDDVEGMEVLELKVADDIEEGVEISVDDEVLLLESEYAATPAAAIMIITITKTAAAILEIAFSLRKKSKSTEDFESGYS